MAIEENKNDNEIAIRELMDRFAKAFRAKDVHIWPWCYRLVSASERTVEQ